MFMRPKHPRGWPDRCERDRDGRASPASGCRCAGETKALSFMPLKARQYSRRRQAAETEAEAETVGETETEPGSETMPGIESGSGTGKGQCADANPRAGECKNNGPGRLYYTES